VAAPAWLDELHFGAGPPWLSMGTRSLDGDLFVRDDDFERDLAWKRDLLASRHGDVFAARDTDAVRDASFEVLALTGGAPVDGLHPLDAAGQRVQEDLCVLVDRDGAPHLDAASLCFPSYWRLADKIGRPLAEVHAPVPHYAEELANKVDRFIARLRRGQTVWRRNWSIHDNAAYFLPEPTPPVEAGSLFLRSERQVLRRLESGAVLFGIRTQQVPLDCLAERPDIAGAMATTIGAWSTELIGYKGGHGAMRAREWLRSQG
jgi:hypothetical protein